MTTLTLALLGQADVRLAGEPLTGFYSGKAQALLFYLAVTGQTHTRPALAGLLWADMPEADALMNLRQVLTNLRKLVGPYVTITRQTVAFNRDSDYRLDVELFQAGVEGANDEADLENIRQAVDLYQGDFLAGFYVRDAPAFETWLVAQQARLRELALGALQRAAAYFARKGDYGNGITYSRRLLALEPWHEETHRRLMLLLARSGQRSAALAQFQTCRQVLAEELSLEPAAETTRLYQRIWAARSRDRPQLPSHPTPLIGREGELARLTDHLTDPACRLLTIVGPGGVGKTRLALQAAADNADLFLSGATFISLTSINSPDEMVSAIADALQFPFSGATKPQTELLAYLRKQERLLVLDNFEHLLASPQGKTPGGVRLLADILTEAPDVKLLVTSRQPVKLRWEWLFDLHGLAYPETDQIEHLEDYSAVHLFLKNAQRWHELGLSEADRSHIGQICKLVEGLPLGIELAASLMRSQPCAAIARAIQKNLSTLATSFHDVPARHKSLQATFTYSWQFLSAPEQAVFKKLSVFQGGFRLEAAERVAGASLAILSALVDKSLLRLASSGRYHIHQLLRQFGAEKLAEAGADTAAMQDRRGAYYAAFLEKRESQLKAGRQEKALAEINEEIDNVRASWQWAVAQGKVKEIGQSVGCLGFFYEIRSWWVEGETTFAVAAGRLEEIRARLTGSASDPWAEALNAALADVLTWWGVFTYRLGLYDKSHDLSQRSLDLLRQIGPQVRRKMALPLLNLGNIMWEQGDYGAARQLHQDSLTIAEAVDAKWDMANALNGLGLGASFEGNQAEAKRLFRNGLAINEAAGDQWGMIFQLANLSEVALDLGNYEEAEQLGQKSLAIAQEIGHDFGAMFSLLELGDAACGLGKYTESKRYFREALALALDIQAVASIPEILTGIAALILTSEATAAGRKRAVELAALIYHHPTTKQETKDRARRLLAQLEAQLSSNVFSIAQTQGRARNLEVVGAEILGGL